jgi:hypothetical protein
MGSHPEKQISDATTSRRLIIDILRALGNVGWHMACSGDLWKREDQAATLLFKYGRRVQRDFYCVSLNERDKVRLIDSPTQRVTEAFKSAIAVCDFFDTEG